MATSDVLGKVNTIARSFALDVEPTLWLFELFDVNGFRLSFVENPTPEVTFPLVPQGAKYTMKVTRNGITASQEFTVPRTINEIDVPVSITVTFG